MTVPLGTAESEAVGELPLQGSPELLTLLLGKLEKIVVVAFELVVLLDDLGVSGVGLVATAVVIVVAATLAATATTTALLYHTHTSVSIRQSVMDGKVRIASQQQRDWMEHGKVKEEGPRGKKRKTKNIHGMVRTLKLPPRPMFERFAIEDRKLCPVAILRFGNRSRVGGRKKSDMRQRQSLLSRASRDSNKKPKPQTYYVGAGELSNALTDGCKKLCVFIGQYVT